jgi:DNA-binding PadR family transcriptional regulator
LRHTRQQIEDSLYFLEKRGYLIRHGFPGLTRVVYQLSDDALKIIETGRFLPEEEQAFQEALLDIRQPGLWGVKFNLGEAWRRVSKWRA